MTNYIRNGGRIMRVGFGGGIMIGAMVGAAISILAEENFNFNRSMRAMSRAGRNITRYGRRVMNTMSHMM